jgi:hypothetical protein
MGCRSKKTTEDPALNLFCKKFTPRRYGNIWVHEFAVLKLEFDNGNNLDALTKELDIGDTEKAILKLYHNNAKSTKEIMEYLELKDKKNFRDRYLLPLIEKQVLNMIYPDKPNHPEQKYYVNKEIIRNK